MLTSEGLNVTKVDAYNIHPAHAFHRAGKGFESYVMEPGQGLGYAAF